MFKGKSYSVVLVIVLIFLAPRLVEIFKSTDKTAIAFYYTWYSDVSCWSNKVKTLPQPGANKCSDPNIVKQHVYWAQMAKIDCFAISYWGWLDDRSKSCLEVVDVLTEQHFKFCLMLEGDSEDFASVQLASSELEKIQNQYLNNPNYLKTSDSKPVIIVFDVPSKVDFWRKIKDLYPDFSFWLSMKQTSVEPSVLSVTDLVSVFDLIDTYNPFSYGMGLSAFTGLPAEVSVITGLQTYFTQKSYWNLQTKYSSVTICLQFDNTAWADIYHDRVPVAIPYSDNIANTYKNELNKNYVFVTSWNEFYENSQCEPSVADGQKLLQALQSLLRNL